MLFLLSMPHSKIVCTPSLIYHTLSDICAKIEIVRDTLCFTTWSCCCVCHNKSATPIFFRFFGTYHMSRCNGSKVLESVDFFKTFHVLHDAIILWLILFSSSSIPYHVMSTRADFTVSDMCPASSIFFQKCII